MMYDKLKELMKAAMLAKKTEEKLTLRNIIGEVDRKKGTKLEDYSDEGIYAVIKKQMAVNNEAIDLMNGKSMAPLALEAENAFLMKLIPQPLSGEQIALAVAQAVVDAEASSMKDMGRVMGNLKKQYGAEMNFALASKILREELQNV